MHELFLTNDGCIAKYVHEDGSETAIKTWPKGMESCGGSGREKFNVFASCSVGCKIKCKFCYLTSKNYPYHELSYNEISNNIITSIKCELKRRPELKSLPFNLSFMGMGDAWLDLKIIKYVTHIVIENISPLVDYIEGIDIGTTLPQASYLDKNILKSIDDILISTNKLATRPSNRSNVRIFYSLHSLNNVIRKTLIPNTLDIKTALKHLNSLESDFNVIYHYVFFDQINDTHEDIDNLINYFKYSNRQLRILRYNKCINSKYEESFQFNHIIETLIDGMGNRLKVQLSPGSEISAACGMFLLKKGEI